VLPHQWIERRLLRAMLAIDLAVSAWHTGASAQPVPRSRTPVFVLVRGA
jgi:hypothetical protein